MAFLHCLQITNSVSSSVWHAWHAFADTSPSDMRTDDDDHPFGSPKPTADGANKDIGSRQARRGGGDESGVMEEALQASRDMPSA